MNDDQHCISMTKNVKRILNKVNGLARISELGDQIKTVYSSWKRTIEKWFYDDMINKIRI